MAIVNYYDSNNRYTDPIRYFKANDPYYFEVDNIPIKQLEENSKFLKDQIDGLVKQLRQSELGRSVFSELLPYVNGGDNTVRVKPGRFTARINDAYTKDPLQVIKDAADPNAIQHPALQGDRWTAQTVNGSTVAAALAKWQSKTAANATLMNGLFERSFVYPMNTRDNPGTGTEESEPKNASLSDVAIPGFKGLLHQFDTNDVTRIIGRYSAFNSDDFRNLGNMESEFIKRWRGAIRTSVVDVDEELTIEIPKFDAAEFFYYDSAGEKQQVTASHRIDLLFIYSKAVDQSRTSVNSWSAGTAKAISKPTLGIVKGAGIGVNQKTNTNRNNRKDLVDLQSLDGVSLMVPNPSDEDSDNTGFKTAAGTVRGSFPSPDDLMNIAPLLSEDLESNAFSLIGQSILPVAYIVVKSTAAVNADGMSVISTDDVIDIRPFFRTTELAYNERAGIAAATPQLSIANPVASEAYVERGLRRLVDDYDAKLSTIGGGAATLPRVVAAGTVKGGMYYGVEGALASYVREQFNATTYSQARAVTEERYGYKANTIPAYPDWDVARWIEQGSYSQKGQKACDRINYHHFGINGNGYATTPLVYGPFKNAPTSLQNGVPSLDPASNPKIDRLGTDERVGGNASDQTLGLTTQMFVSKRILLDRSQIPWADDYYVVAQLSNCVPLTAGVHNSKSSNTFSKPSTNAGIWIDKRANEFTIFVSWACPDPLKSGDMSFITSEELADNRDNGDKYAGFTVQNFDIMRSTNPNGGATGTGIRSVNAGVALYPTVTFQVIGVPASISSATRTSLSQASPTLTLL